MPRLTSITRTGSKIVAPTWSTPSGSLATIADIGGSYTTIATVVATVIATPGINGITYAITSGNLPPGCSLNASTGVISGDPTDITTNTISTFSITPTVRGFIGTSRSFSITVTTTNFSGLYYNEGTTAQTTGWNNATTYYMADFGGLGGCTAHGFTSGPVTFTLTKTGLPRHSNIRYIVYWHMVDSLDNETSSLYTGDGSISTERFRWTKVYNAVPSFSVIASGASQVFNDAKSYSYRPWGNGGYGHDGYSVLDTGYYSHTSSTFTATHNMGADQAQGDEAMYLTHVQIYLS